MKKLLLIAIASLAVAAMAEGETQFSPVIGVTKITTTNKLTIISVPFASLDGGGPISVKDLVSGKGLDDNTWAYVFANNSYTAWNYTAKDGWVGAVQASDTLGVNTEAAQNNQTIASPGAIWIDLPSAPVAGTPKDIYIIGNYDNPPTSQAIVAGNNLVANPLQGNATFAFTGTPAKGDVVIIQCDNLPERYTYTIPRQGETGWYRNNVKADLPPVGAGLGFWLIKGATSGITQVNWTAAQ